MSEVSFTIDGMAQELADDYTHTNTHDRDSVEAEHESSMKTAAESSAATLSRNVPIHADDKVHEYSVFCRCLARPIAVCLIGLLLTACDNDAATTMTASPSLQVTQAQLSLGETVYRENCQSCHGEQAEGHAQWRKRDEHGKFPPPPLNGSGHAWHHSTGVLSNVINNGSLDGMGNMPAWKGKLSEDEVQAVILWFQSLWPQPIYQAWYEIQQR